MSKCKELLEKLDKIVEGKDNPRVPDGTGSVQGKSGRGMGLGKGKNKEKGCNSESSIISNSDKNKIVELSKSLFKENNYKGFNANFMYAFSEASKKVLTGYVFNKLPKKAYDEIFKLVKKELESL